MDRNQLFTALMEETYSHSAYYKAKETVNDMMTQPIPNIESHIFMNLDLLNALKCYWIERQNNLCTMLRLISLPCKKRTLKKYLTPGIKTFPNNVKMYKGQIS